MSLKRFRKIFNELSIKLRSFFIKEKKQHISYRTIDNINFSFRNSSVYSDIGLYRTIMSLFFISIILIVFSIFVYLDFKSNIDRNKELVKSEPLVLNISDPLSIDLPIYHKDIVYDIRSGDNLTNILTNIVGISNSEAYNCISALKEVYNTNSLYIGQKLFIKYKDDAVISNTIHKKVNLEELRIIDDNNLKEIIVSRENDGTFKSSKNNVVLSKTYNKYIFDISSSLYYDAVTAGVPSNIIANIISYYSFDIDFQRDIRKGDWLEVVFEAYYTENGKKVKNGDIIYSNLHSNKEDHKIYRFIDGNYYNENGVSTQKSLLRTPINGARISSGFQNQRKHPVLGYTRAHKGVDFAAPSGTPFYAAGNGTITKIVSGCRNGDRSCGGGFGNYISIKHNNTYTTEYAHISSIAKGMKVGMKVKQGQIIAYVGNTGLSSGPHLHYGVIYRGERINPSRLKSTPNKRLIGGELLSFISNRDRINTMRSIAINQNKLE